MHHILDRNSKDSFPTSYPLGAFCASILDPIWRSTFGPPRLLILDLPLSRIAAHRRGMGERTLNSSLVMRLRLLGLQRRGSGCYPLKMLMVMLGLISVVETVSRVMPACVIPRTVCGWNRGAWLSAFHIVGLQQPSQLQHLCWRRGPRDAMCRYTVSQKTNQLWNGIAQNYKDRFWWHLAEIFRIF